jgi:hypothetical protein
MRSTLPLLLLVSACNAVLGIPDPRPGAGAAPDAGDSRAPDGVASDSDASESSDASASGSPPPDAGPLDVPGDCAPDSAFVTFAPVGGVNTPVDELHPWLARDERTLVFSRVVAGRYHDLFIAHRANRTDDFDPAGSLDELNSVDDEYSASMSDDGRTVYFDRQVSGAYAVFTATRANRNAVFEGLALLPVVNGAWQDFEPFIADDGLYFASTRDDGQASLYFARSSSDGGFESPGELEPTPSGAADENPAASFDGLTLYFSRSTATGVADIWTASRPSRGASFGPPTPIEELKSPGLQVPGWLSEDNCRLYFATDRAGSLDLWVATRRPRQRALGF